MQLNLILNLISFYGVILPVVKAGVHSCSPVAPHKSVSVLEGSTVTIGPAGECNVDILRLPKTIPNHSDFNQDN